MNLEPEALSQYLVQEETTIFEGEYQATFNHVQEASAETEDALTVHGSTGNSGVSREFGSNLAISVVVVSLVAMSALVFVRRRRRP